MGISLFSIPFLELAYFLTMVCMWNGRKLKEFAAKRVNVGIDNKKELHELVSECVEKF